MMHVIMERHGSGSSEQVSRFPLTKAKAGPDGRPVIRCATLLNFLKRVALTHNLQFTPCSSAEETANHNVAWRLDSDCFAVQICVTKAAPMEFDGPTFVPGATNFDELVHSLELVSDLNAGKFESLAQHIRNLMTIYSIPGSNLERVRAYLCLHVLEQDLSLLSQTQRADLTEAERNAALALRPLAIHTMDPADRQRMVNSSIVGLFLKRSGGRLAKLTYLITSAQTAMAKATEQHNSADGLSRSTGFVNEPDELKCVALEAELVLYLDPPIPLPTEAVRELERITGLKNTELLDKDEDDLTRLILAQHNQHYLYGINPHILLPNYTQHSYAVRSHVRGFLVRTVPFTCSNELMTFRFDIEISSGAPLHVSFDHPCDPSRRIDLSIQIGPFGVTHAQLNDVFLAHDTHYLTVSNLDPTEIFFRSHSLPVGLVWLLLRLGCPVQRSLRVLESSRSLSALNETSRNHRSGFASGHQLTTATRLEQLRAMLSRAKSHVLIQGATGTGGILSGADRFAAPELDTPLLHPLPTMPSLSARSSLRLPPLPPGVLATTPPVLPHTEHNSSLDLVSNVLSTVRGSESSGRPVPSSGAPSPSVITSGSRGLRLDDLLIGNVIQQCFATSTTSSTTCSSVPVQSISTAASTIPASGLAAVNDYPPIPANPLQPSSLVSQSKLVSAMREFTPEPLASPGLCSTVSPKQSMTVIGPQSGHGASNHINAANTCPPYSLQGSYGSRPGGVSVSTANISIPGTFTQSSPIISPLLGVKPGSATNTNSKTSGSGSMLVNLLNEDPMPPAAPSLSQAAHCGPSSRVAPPLTQPPPGLSSYSDLTRDPYALPGTTGSSRFISSPQDKLSPLGPGKLSGSTATPLSGGPNMLPGVVQQPKPVGLHSPRSTGSLMTSSTAAKPRSTTDAYNLPGASDTTVSTTAIMLKKTRKRRRAGAENATVTPTFKSSSSANTVPGAGVLCAPASASSTVPVKHSRIDAATVPHGSLHRSTFCGGSSGGSAGNFSMTSSSATIPSTSGHSGANATASGKSVYDFDDNPNSSFDIPSLPQNNSMSSTAYQSGSTANINKLTTPSSTYVSGQTASSNTVSIHPPNLGPSSAMSTTSIGPVAERTVERKTSLKVTIKTLPPQQPNNAFTKTTSSAEVVHSTHSPDIKSKHSSGASGVSGLKKHKRPSVDGKPSSYMLQMLQPPTSTSSIHSGSSLTGVKLSKPNTALSHANSIVKKERKRRMAHMMTERIPSASATGMGGSIHTGDSSSTNMDSLKLSKANRSRENSVERIRSKPIQATSSGGPERGGPSASSMAVPGLSGTTIPSRKKVTSSPLSTPGDDSGGIRRQHLSSTGTPLPHIDSVEIKRRKHGDGNKHAMSSQLNLSGSSLSESDDMLSLSSVTSDSGSINMVTLKHSAKSSSSSSVSGTMNPTTNRAGSGNTSNSGSKSSAMPSYSMGSQVSAISNSGVGVTGNTSGTSVGLIKGYKIPKKKTTSQSNSITPSSGMGKSETNTPSATSSNSSDGGSKTIGKNLQAEPVKENSDYSGHPSNQNSANLSGSHLIKAQTDTPASPTEASTPVPPTPPSDLTSKIIPISPTSAKRMGANQTQIVPASLHSDRPGSQSRGSLISRKNPTSARFPRPTMSMGGSHPHGVPDSFMRSMSNHPRGARPPRAFSHGMHRPKAGAFKGHGNWPSGPVDFTGSAPSSGNEPPGPGGPMPPGPWRMPGGASVPGTSGGGGPQQPYNPSNPPHVMPMHGFPSGGSRPMQHPPGAFGGGGSMYGGSM
ncbi:unnamed protein product [Echinostoma caproni]|uniref:AAA domain-containing protein n=1 Tax=Echinostoma caproni TaxID=27848 RepID=A0A183AGG2_9TREM|nr:unnamed protein product [Echinostoma caproni]